MTRVSLWVLAACVLASMGSVRADEAAKKEEHTQASHASDHHQIDAEQGTVSVKMMNKKGKERNKTLH